jgi:hypothetical protein
MTEWRPVPGFPAYEVSALGEVRRGGRQLSLFQDGSGYLAVTLCEGGVRKRFRVHSVVLLAFAGPRPRGAVSRHLDGDPHNNAAENLTYGTQSENMRDRIAHGTDPNASRSECHRGHPYTEANTYVGMNPGGRPCRVCRACTRERHRARREARVI